ncbi:hypothetical protein Tco_0929915, partial [Tanacetum coccineum]
MSDIRAQERSDPLRPSRIALSLLCALQVYTTCIMDVSGSPNRVSDYPDGDTLWTYSGFAPGPPLGYTGNPSGSGGWLEADDLPIHAMRTTDASEPVIEVVAPLVEEVREPIEPIVAPETKEIVGPTKPMDAPMIGGNEDMSLVVTLDKCMISFGYPNLLTNSTRLSGVGGEEKARSEEIGLLENVHSNLENWVGLRFFFIQIAVAFPNWHPANA